MRQRRRIITRVIVFLLLIVGGAIVNVAVAWGVTWSTPELSLISGGRSIIELSDSGMVVSYCRTDVHEGFGTRAYRIMWAHGEVKPAYFDGYRRAVDVLPSWLRGLQPSQQFTSGEITREGVAGISHGWPWGALADLTFQSADHADYAWSLRMGERDGEPLLMPLRPLWPGFAINTVFYAVILWLLLAAPFALRRRMRGGRIKRGLCPACAYPVGDSPVCTECGEPCVNL